jgi:replicative DNA helicase
MNGDIHEVERFFLGALLFAVEYDRPIATRLRRDDFDKPEYQRVFETLYKQVERGITPDIMSLARELTDIDPALIAELTSAVISDANLAYYESEIAQASLNRTVKRALNLAKLDADRGVDGNTIINNLMPTLTALTTATNENAVIPADALMRMTFPPYEWVVKDLIGQGLTLLVGAPKIGKSWLVLAIAAAVSTPGGRVLGTLETKQTSVLYLALEDTPRRLNDRLLKMGMTVSNRLLIATQWSNGATGLHAYLRQHPEIKLLIVDTFGRFAGLDDLNDYAATTTAMARLKGIADELDLAIVVIHHAKKTGKGSEPSDWLESSLGSTGLTGAADSVIMLKRDRDTSAATLYATGRDTADLKLNLRFDGACGTWTIGNPASDTPVAAPKPEALPNVYTPRPHRILGRD